MHALDLFVICLAVVVAFVAVFTLGCYLSRPRRGPRKVDPSHELRFGRFGSVARKHHKERRWIK